MCHEGEQRNFDLCEFDESRNAESMVEFYHPIWNATARALKASMLQDLEKGKPCEIDYINGEIIRAGKKHGIPTPYNDLLAAIVKLAQGRKQVWTPEEILPMFRAMLIADGYELD